MPLVRAAIGCLSAGALCLPVVSQAAQRTVSFRTEDGVVLTATWFEANARPAPTVILLHMLTRSRRDWEAIGEGLAEAGIHALALDFRGHGESGFGSGVAGGSPDLTRLLLDVRAAHTFLESLAGLVRTSAIGVAGASLGANVGLLDAARNPVVQSLVMLSPSLEYRSLRAEGAMRSYADRPALLVAGANDPYALRSMRSLAALGSGVRETRTVSAGGHGTVMLGRDPDLKSALVDWFLRTLL